MSFDTTPYIEDTSLSPLAKGIIQGLKEMELHIKGELTEADGVVVHSFDTPDEDES